MYLKFCWLCNNICFLWTLYHDYQSLAAKPMFSTPIGCLWIEICDAMRVSHICICFLLHCSCLVVIHILTKILKQLALYKAVQSVFCWRQISFNIVELGGWAIPCVLCTVGYAWVTITVFLEIWYLKGLWNVSRQHDMCKNIIYNYTLLVTNIRLFIRQTKKHTLFNAQIDQINHCISASKYWYESLLSCPCKISSLRDF